MMPARLWWTAGALGCALFAARPASSQVVPPNAVAPAGHATPWAFPSLAPWLRYANPKSPFEMLPPSHRCGTSSKGVTVIGRIPPIHERNTFGVAAIIERGAGNVLENRLHRSLDIMQHTVLMQTDRVAMSSYAVQVQREEDAKIAKLSFDQRRSELEKRLAENRALPAAEQVAKIVPIDARGHFRCAGLTPGAYEVFVATLHLEPNVRDPKLAGTLDGHLTVKSGPVDVPETVRPRQIRIPALKWLGEVDPNHAPFTPSPQ